MSQNLTCILVEDEKNSREILRNYLIKYCPNVTILGEAERVDEALSLIRNLNPDLVFLDVEMPYGNAFDLLDTFDVIPFETVFVTAYNQYAMEALNQHAAYYLLKLISIDELIKAVDYVTNIKEKERAISGKLLSVSPLLQDEKISLPVQSGFEFVSVADILYCRADDNYTHIYMQDGNVRLISKTLGFFEKQLHSKGFYRVHKSYLINLSYIQGYQKGKGGVVVLSNGKSIPVASSKKGAFLDLFR